MITESFILVLVFISGCLCCLAVGICAIMSTRVSVRITTLEPGLLVYLKIVLTLSFVRPISSMVISLYCLCGNDVNSQTAFYMRLVTTFSGNMIIISAFGISIDCVVASVTRRQTPLLRKWIHGCLAAAASVFYALTVSIVYFASKMKLLTPLSMLTTSMHLICFITEVVILIINIRRHKIISSGYQLSTRHNLVRNIKLLRFNCPCLLIVTVCCGCGPVTNLFATYNGNTSTVLAIGFIYFFYNVGVLFVVLFFIMTCFKEARRIQKRVTDVKYNNEIMTTDHFDQLKRMWK